MANKHFLTLFKRAFDYMPEVFEEVDDEDPDCGFTILKDEIDDGCKKNWDNTKKKVRELLEDGDKDGELEPLKNAFKSYFTSYNDIIKQRNDKEPEKTKKAPKWIELLNYLTGDIICNGKQYFGEDEKPNYAASNVLKISDTVVQDFPDNCLQLPQNLKKCFPYMQGVIGFSDNWRTLTNDLDVISNTIKNESHESPLKKDIIPVVTNFMDQKYKFRYPNLICLNMLDEYLNPTFVQTMLTNPNVKENPNYGLNYVNAIDSVMAKPFYPSSTVLKEADYDDDKDDVNDTKEPKDEETERKILVKGSQLLKRLIPMETFLKEVKDFKKNANSFVPEASKVDDVLKLENNLIYQNCALNVDDFFNAGSNDDFNTLKDLIKKEISFIEGFKRLKANENNPKYKEICDASNKRLHLELGTLRKLEDQGIDKLNKTQQDNYRTLLRDITSLNNEVITKSTDGPNLMEHLQQLRQNVAFIRDHEKELTNDPVKTTSDNYIGSLMSLLRKALNNEDLCDSVVKTLTAFASKKPEICNSLVKSGCPRLLLQIMDTAQSRPLVVDCMELLKMITLSSKENAEVIGNQNILMNLLQIRSKFASVENITKPADEIANELMKLPGQDKYAEGLIRDAIKEFHQNVQKDFTDPEVKNKILGNEEMINSFTTNKKTSQPILEEPFIKDLNKAVDMATKSPDVSVTIDSLLTNDMGILKKIKDNLPTKEDPRHGDVAADTLKILLDKSNFEEPLLLACKVLGDYVKDDTLFKKHVNDKIDDGFVNKLYDIQDDYLDNPEVTKEINNILSYLAMRKPVLADTLMSRGGLAGLLQELKAVADLNDPASKLLKANGLKMLNSLLNNPENLDEFLKNDGVDLLNKIIKNDVDTAAKNKPGSKDDDLPYAKYFTKGTISTKTPEQLKEDEKLGVNSFAHLGLTKEEGDKKRDELLKDLENKNKNGPSEEEEPKPEDSDNYLVQCLQIINKGLDNGKDEFVDEKTVKNLTNLASLNFPDRNLFNEIANILSNENVKFNPESLDDLKDLMKLGLSNQAQFYRDNNVADKVKAIEDKISDMLMDNPEYRNGFRSAIKNKGMPKEEKKPPKTFLGTLKGAIKTPEEEKNAEEELNDKNKLLTYLSLATEPEAFQKVFNDIRPEIGSFFNHMVQTYRPVIDKILDDKENKLKELALQDAKNAFKGGMTPEEEKKIEPFNLNNLKNDEKYDEGVVIALAKLYNYLLEQAPKYKNDQNLAQLTKNKVGGDKKDAPLSYKPGQTLITDDDKLPSEKNKFSVQYVKVKGDQLKKYAEEPDYKKNKVNQLFSDRNLDDDLEDQDEQDGGINYYVRKVLGKNEDKPDSEKIEKIPGEANVDDIYKKLRSKNGDFKSPDEGIQLLKVVGKINPKDVTNHMNNVNDLYNKGDKEGEDAGTTLQTVTLNEPNKNGVREPVQYVKCKRGKPKPGQEPISYYKVKGGKDVRDMLDQIQKNGEPDGKDGVDYEKVKGDQIPKLDKIFGDAKSMPKTYYFTSIVKGDGKDNKGKPYEDGKVHSVTVLSDPLNKTNKNNKVKDVFRKAEENQGKRKPKPKKDDAKYYYTKVVGSKMVKPSDIKLTKVPKDTNMKEIYDRVKPLNTDSKKPEDGKDDGVLVVKVTGDANLKEILDQIKDKDLIKFKPEEEKELAKNNLRGAPRKLDKKGEPEGRKTDYKGAKRPNEIPTYDYKKDKGKNKNGDDYAIGGIKILGDEFSRYEDPENDFELGKMIEASEIEPYDNVVKGDKTPKYYYTKLIGEKLGNLKEDDIDLVEATRDKPMSDIHTDVRKFFRPKKPGQENNDGVQLIKTVGKPDKKDIIKFILDNNKKDVPLTINYIKVSGTKWAKPNNSINYIKVSGDSLARPGEPLPENGKKPEVYFKVPDDKDMDEALDQIKEGKDLLDRPKPGDKFQRVTGDELEDVKKYFDDKEKGLMKPTDVAPMPRDPTKVTGDKVPEFDESCISTKVLGNGIEVIDNDGNNDIEWIKVSGDQLNNFANPQKPSDQPCNIRTLFRHAKDDKDGTKYYFRKVLGKNLDKPEKDPLSEVAGNTNVDNIYDQVKSKDGNFKSPEEGIQLIKVVGNVNPNDITDHLNDSKNMYRSGDDGRGVGTTVQTVTVNRPNKFGVKEPVQYIKARRARPKKGEEPVSFYKVKGGKDARDILDQIQNSGKPDGKDGEDYEKVKGAELPDVKKLFDNKDIPKTFYYTTKVKGNGKNKDGTPYDDGTVQSVTILSDPDNKTNKNHQVLEVFRKAEEANEKKDPEKDNATYYYTKTLGSVLSKDDLKSPQVIKVPGNTDLKDIYDKVKGDMSHEPGDKYDDIILIKSKGDKNINELLDQTKVLGSVLNQDKFGGRPKVVDNRPGLEKLDVGDDKCEVVKVT